ncbi:hypothetical protein ABIB06_006560 [Bradyrhizobium sp. LB8.2]|uniref:hypothetical protein n=1 Tax=unclassified Bradyrhizobium TaxID=2631580 RepID=UPI00339817BC
MKNKFMLLGTLLAALVVGLVAVADAQTFATETSNDYLTVHSAQHTSSTTGTYKSVPSTRGTMTMLISSSVAGVTATLTLSTKGTGADSANGSIVSTSALTLFTTPTAITVAGPLNFQKVKLTLNAPGAATASDTRIFSRQ